MKEKAKECGSNVMGVALKMAFGSEAAPQIILDEV